MICQKKNKKLHVFYLLLLLSYLVLTPCLSSVNSYASDFTDVQSVREYFSEHDFYDTCAWVCRKYASFPYLDYMTGASSGIVYDNFLQYLEDNEKTSMLDENVTITGTGGGRGYEIPQDVRQEMLNFVTDIYISQNPLGYSEAYIYSYKFLNPSSFPTYNMYKSVQSIISGFDGYSILFMTYNSGQTLIYQISRNQDFGLVGTVTSGSFSGAVPYVNWSSIGNNVSNVKFVNQDGSYTTGSTNWGSTTVSNANSPSNSRKIIISNYDKNELVYVFPTLNAYKNYVGANQPYYFPSNSQTTVPYYDGFTQSDLNNAANFYNNITMNGNSTDNPNQIRQRVDSVLGGIGKSDSDDTSLLGGLGDIITGATGAISPIKELVLGDLKDFVEDVFSWLPPSIVTIWIAGITFGVFFGILKVIRG